MADTPETTFDRLNLTDTYLKSLKRTGKRYERADTQAPGLKVRVSPKGVVTFYVWRRFGGKPNPSSRFIGEYGPEVGQVTLAKARETAREWTALSKAGKDPVILQAEREAQERAQKAAQEAEAKAEAAKSEATFGKLLVRYGEHIAHQRQAAGVLADMRRDLLPFWEHTPVDQIKRKDVRDRVKEVAKRSTYQAYAAFGNTRTFFNWLRDTEEVAIETVPTDGMRAKKIVGKPKKSRDRVLTDDEIFAFWRAALRTPYPLGPGYRLLLLTAARLNEVFEADRREVNPSVTTLTVPPERFKSDKEHMIALSRQATEIIASLPRWNAGTYLFSRDGIEPARVWTKDRERLSKRMTRTLKALARIRGENPANVMLKPFVLHDLRRTVRTRLSALKVPHEVKELILGHELQGLDRVYDQHTYHDEMREALEKWSDRLAQIVAAPIVANVTAIRKIA